ncbi:tetratricopeptide repeat protein [Geomonas nitrogeniifigens]|uniref:Tetratricopeptide repeat protein n=1 Tax=Geomonas diazotrophica TaxID=2843197 RepID=A0ABX8JDP3_9BACT|nr:tetratricopeptide repeat protein [Geomonas nitrogeniifigens]QWV96514.1 tetratricopeptide repeat protein [Geomonas nitrogeniifigens]
MTAASSKGDTLRTTLLSIVILAVVTLSVYGVSFSNGFVMDDEVIIVNNPQTLSLSNIPDVLFAPDLIKPYYRPLNRATYLFDFQLAGMRPAWYHAVNIFIHLGNVVLLFLVLRLLLRDRLAALAAALLFAVHPANAEAVNFISARNTLMALFFGLASFLSYLQGRAEGKKLLWFSSLLYFCSLLSKETGIMMSAVLFVATFMRLQESERPLNWKDRIILLAPYGALTLLYFAMRAYSLQGIVGTPVPAEGLFSRLAINYHIIPQYIALLLFPADLTLFHKVPQGGIFSPAWYLPLLLLLLAVVVYIFRSGNRVAIFAFGWMVINYIPISNIVPIPSDFITERYLYMPAAGFFIWVGLLWRAGNVREGGRRWLIPATAIVLVAALVLTFQRNLDWKDNLSLFSSGVRNDPASPGAHYNLGTSYLEHGDIAAAQREWETTLRLNPQHAEAMVQMGTLAAVRGDLGTAERYYLAALAAPPGETDPDKAMAHLNLGKICEKRGQLREALQHYQHFLRTVPLTYLEYKGEVEKKVKSLMSTVKG